MCLTGEPDPNRMDECRSWHEKRISTRRVDAVRYGLPLFISEFGGCLNSTTCVEEITAVATACDEALAGWAYWQLKKYADITTGAGTGFEGFYNADGSI
jgi:hypothetical protein